MLTLTYRVVAANAGILLGLSLLLGFLNLGPGSGSNLIAAVVEFAVLGAVTYCTLRAVLFHKEGASFNVRPSLGHAFQWQELQPFLVSFVVLSGVYVALFVAALVGFSVFGGVFAALIPFLRSSGFLSALQLLAITIILLQGTASFGTMLVASVAGGDRTLRGALARSQVNMWTTTWRLAVGPLQFAIWAHLAIALLLLVLPHIQSGAFLSAFLAQAAVASVKLFCNVYIWVIVAVAYLEAQAAGVVSE
ncbi:MAG: hypothetical protein AAGA38_01395 [Pseudomonadota bacterium]